MNSSAVGAWRSVTACFGTERKWYARVLLYLIVIAMWCLAPDKGHATALPPVENITVTYNPAYIVPKYYNEWTIRFTTNVALNEGNGDKIFVEFPSGYEYKFDSDNKLASEPEWPAIYVNDVDPDSITITGQKIGIPVQGSIGVGDAIEVYFESESVINPPNVVNDPIKISTSVSAAAPVSSPLTMTTSTLNVSAHNLVQGAEETTYVLSYYPKTTISSSNRILLDARFFHFSASNDNLKINGQTVQQIAMDDALYITPVEGQTIGSSQLVTIELKGAVNPRDPGTYLFSITEDDRTVSPDYAAVIIGADTASPSGTVTINGGQAVTYSRIVNLQFHPTDSGGSGVTGYKLSSSGLYSEQMKRYRSSQLYKLPDGQGLKTIYVKYLDGAGNQNSNEISASIMYSDELDLTDLTAAAGGVPYPVTPAVTQDEPSSQISVPSSVSSLTLTPTKRSSSAAISASGSNVTFNGTDVVVSNLQPGSNYVDIAVKKADGSAQKVYKLLIYKQGSALNAAKGSKILLGGQLWTLVDPEKRTLLMDAPATGCPWKDAALYCEWEKGKWSWNMNDLAYRFRTDYPYTIPYYLNHEFYESLGSDKGWIDEFPFDDTTYEYEDISGLLPPERTRSTETRTVGAKVGLLSVKEYTQLKNDGTLSSESGYSWYLMNPQDELYLEDEFTISRQGVDGDTGAIISEPEPEDFYDFDRFYIRPVIHLNDRAVIISGDGTQDWPYMIGSGEGLKNIAVNGGSLSAKTPTGTTYPFDITAPVNSAITITADVPSNVALTVNGLSVDVHSGALTVTVPANENNVTMILTEGMLTKTYLFSITRSGDGDGHISWIGIKDGSKLLFMPNEQPPTWSLNVNSVVSSVYMNVYLSDPTHSRLILDSTVTGVTYGPKSISYENLNFGLNTINFTLRFDNNSEKHYRILITRENAVVQKAAAPIPVIKYESDTVMQVSLSSPTEGASIYYTVDGSPPSASSSKYIAGTVIKLSPGQTLKAIAIKPGWQDSDVIAIPGQERYGVKEVVNRINSKTDSNGDGVFDRRDVIYWLNHIPPRIVQELITH